MYWSKVDEAIPQAEALRAMHGCCSAATPVLALNEFVAANRTLASSHNRPKADRQENFKEGTLLGHSGQLMMHWNLAAWLIKADIKVEFTGVTPIGETPLLRKVRNAHRALTIRHAIALQIAGKT